MFIGPAFDAILEVITPHIEDEMVARDVAYTIMHRFNALSGEIYNVMMEAIGKNQELYERVQQLQIEALDAQRAFADLILMYNDVVEAERQIRAGETWLENIHNLEKVK